MIILSQVYDSNMEAIETEGLELVNALSGSMVQQRYTTEFNTFIGAVGEHRAIVIEALWGFWVEWLARGLNTNIPSFFPILGGLGTDARYKNLITGGATMSVSGGDAVPSYAGLSGAGSAHYLHGFNPSNDITDINNFTIALTTMTDDDAGTDFGSSDGTNEVSIAAKKGGSAVLKVGTVSLTSTVTTGKTITILNVQAGTLKGWQVTGQAVVAMSDGPTVAGSLPAVGAYLCALNTNSVAGDHSSKIVKNIVIYDGLLDDSGVRLLGFSLLELNFKLNTPTEWVT